MHRFKHYNYDQDAMVVINVPHFTTLARFVSEQAEEMEALFEQVLRVCHEQGLLGNELFAIDGCKMSSNAAKEGSGTFSELQPPDAGGVPVFGNIGTNKGPNRFSVRGKKKVQGQWPLYCLVHNIETLMNDGQMAA